MMSARLMGPPAWSPMCGHRHLTGPHGKVVCGGQSGYCYCAQLEQTYYPRFVSGVARCLGIPGLECARPHGHSGDHEPLAAPPVSRWSITQSGGRALPDDWPRIYVGARCESCGEDLFA